MMLMVEKKRRDKGWTQTELGFYAKISAQEVSRIERGWARPYNGQAARLSEVLGIPADELTKEAR